MFCVNDNNQFFKENTKHAKQCNCVAKGWNMSHLPALLIIMIYNIKNHLLITQKWSDTKFKSFFKDKRACLWHSQPFWNSLLKSFVKIKIKQMHIHAIDYAIPLEWSLY